MKVLVTGANGLLGHHVVMQLIEKQHDVKIIIRSKKEIYFDINKTEVVVGNFADENTFRLAAQNCQAIIHIAAITATNLLRYDDYLPINVTANKMIIAVANELNIRNIVFISSANTIGFGTKDNLSDETAAIQFPFSRSFYAQSKLESEKLYVNASKVSDNHIIIINPSFMIGDFDTKPSSGKLILMGLNKRFVFVPKGGKNFVPVADVATAVCNALTLGKSGERYLATGVNITFKEFYERQSRVGAYNQTIIVLPDMLLELAAKLGDLLQFAGIKTDLCSRNINQLTIREYYTNRKSINELRMLQTPLDAAIAKAIKWFKNKPIK